MKRTYCKIMSYKKNVYGDVIDKKIAEIVENMQLLGAEILFANVNSTPFGNIPYHLFILYDDHGDDTKIRAYLDSIPELKNL